MIFSQKITLKLHRRCDFWSCRHFVDILSIYTLILFYNTLIYQVAIFMLTIVRQMWYNNIVVIMVGKN